MFILFLEAHIVNSTHKKLNWIHKLFLDYLLSTTACHTGLSKLNLHKFKHKFKDTVNPMCSINDGFEDTEHFLLLCHSYDAQRQDLLDTINPILEPQDLSNLSNKAVLKILLYGDERLPLKSNTMVLEATIKYIYATERFD